MNLLNQHIEALIFCSEQSISIDEIAASLKFAYDWEPSEEEILAAIEVIKTKYLSEDFAFELMEIAEGYQFLTKKDFQSTVSALIQHKAKKRLSTSAMETLAIVAYKQPVTKGEVEHIRGVNCDYAFQKLLEKELIEIHGKSDAPGKPLVYVTSKSFMDYFGIKSVKDLPQLKDLHVEQNEIGPPTDYAETEETFIVETVVEEESVSIEDKGDVSFLPDRKAIFIENEEKKSAAENEISAGEEEENSFDSPRD
jgi:segregation and condensation protein B